MPDTLSPLYREIVACVDRVPRTATEVYRRWADIPEWKTLTRRRRNERRWLAHALTHLAEQGVIIRATLADAPQPHFWRLDDEADPDPYHPLPGEPDEPY